MLRNAESPLALAGMDSATENKPPRRKAEQG
jgi:hypothetical protein